MKYKNNSSSGQLNEAPSFSPKHPNSNQPSKSSNRTKRIIEQSDSFSRTVNESRSTATSAILLDQGSLQCSRYLGA